MLSSGDLPSQIESSSMIQIWISNSDDDLDTNPIPSRRLSRGSGFKLIFFIKIDQF